MSVIFCLCLVSDTSAAAGQLQALQASEDSSKTLDTGNKSLTKSGNLNLIHEGENAVANQVPDSVQLENKPKSEPAAESKQELQSTHTQKQVHVSEKNMQNPPEQKPLSTPKQELQSREDLKPGNTSLHNLRIMQETDNGTDSTQENDVQTTTLQKTDSKPIQESGYSDREETGIEEKPGMTQDLTAENNQIKTLEKISDGGNENALKTNSVHIKALDGTADTTDPNKADDGVSTEEEQNKPESNSQTEAEDTLGRQEHEEDSNPKAGTASSTDLQDEEETNSMDTENMQGSAEGDEKFETENDEKDDDEEEGSDDNSEDDTSQVCSGSEDDGSNISEESTATRPKNRLKGPGSSKRRRQKKRERKERKKLNNESSGSKDVKGVKKGTSETKEPKHQKAQQSTISGDAANSSKVFGSAPEVHSNVDSGVPEPLDKPSLFSTTDDKKKSEDDKKKSTQTPTTKPKKEQVCTVFTNTYLQGHYEKTVCT